jgi:Cu(I)/Ag(I) efflux system membrane fusion protein
MSNRRQLWGSLAIIAVALVVTGFMITGNDATADAEGGHDHAAMSAARTEARAVDLDPDAQRRIGVTYAVAERMKMSGAVRAAGTITFDETRVSSVNPRVEGWVERLHVDYTGAAITKGQPLMDIYSPMLVAAQEELVLARRLLDQTADAESRTAQNARELLDAARRRLAHWGIAPRDIEDVEHNGPRRTLPLRATASGVVLEKNVVAGTRIMPGMDVYRIGDLSRVWIEVDVFEKDIGRIANGTHAVVTLESYPGESFAGRVTFIAPVVSPETRTARARVELPNTGQRLKPGMYASVELHPQDDVLRLVVPRSAVLTTGTRSLVFVRAADGSLTPRNVITGLALEHMIEIVSGLAVGDVVVASASFLIDAESNIE